jgi:hypothetical protein
MGTPVWTWPQIAVYIAVLMSTHPMIAEFRLQRGFIRLLSSAAGLETPTDDVRQPAARCRH